MRIRQAALVALIIVVSGVRNYAEGQAQAAGEPRVVSSLDEIPALLEQRLGPGYTVTQQGHARHEVKLTISRANGELGAEYRIIDRSGQCNFFAIGDWCLQTSGHVDSKIDGVLRILLREIAMPRQATPLEPAPRPAWQVDNPPPDYQSPQMVQPPWLELQISHLPSWLVAVLLVIVPLALGWTIGRLARPQPGGARIVGPILVAVAIGAAVAIGMYLRVGLYDSIWFGVLLGGALIATLYQAVARIGRDKILVATVAVLLALVVAEIGARFVFLPSPPFDPKSSFLFMPPFEPNQVPYLRRNSTDHFLQWSLLRSDACALIYPDQYPVPFLDRVARSKAPTRAVIHVGDSMTFGMGVPPWATFTALLERHDPSVAHFNAGANGMSTDFYYAVVHHWVERLPTVMVVVYLFLNDPPEVDRYMPCCRERPLLQYGPDGVRERCPQPDWEPGYGNSVGWFARNSELPLPLFELGNYSRLFNQIRFTWMQRFNQNFYDSGHEKTSWDYFARDLAAIHDDMRARGIALVVVTLPLKPSLQMEDSHDTDGYRDYLRMKSTAEDLGIPTLDPWDYIGEQVHRYGADAVFLSNNDVHFNARGHALMAEWLSTRLPQYMAAEPAQAKDLRLR